MEIKSFELKEVEVEERTFTGYAAAYGNEDSDGDVIMKGAFAESLANDFPRKKNQDFMAAQVKRAYRIASRDARGRKRPLRKRQD